MNILGPRLSFFKAVDDTLGIVHTHLIAGTVGGFLTGIFATAEGCAAFALLTPGGAIEGNGKQVGWQLAGALFIIGWNVVWTSLICCFIKYVLRIPLRMTDEACMIGDDIIHGESAYTFGDDIDTISGRKLDDEEAGVSATDSGEHHHTLGAATETTPVTDVEGSKEIKQA